MIGDFVVLELPDAGRAAAWAVTARAINGFLLRLEGREDVVR